jgi:hypothetical protein
MRIMSGRVSATTWAPAASARSEASSCCSQISSEARLPSRFQLSDRSAARDISAISCTRSSGMGPTEGMNSRVVPGWPRSAPARATNSSGAAALEGTGRPSPSRWPSPSEEEKPSAPPARDASTRSTMAPICAGSATARVASSPITARRTVEWPTRKPALTARPVSTRSRYSAKERHSQGPVRSSAPSGMPSTTAIIRWM